MKSCSVAFIKRHFSFIPIVLLDHTLSQIWTSPMMWLFLPSYLNSLCLHLRWWHQKLHVLGSSWIGRRQESKLWGAGRMYHHQSQFWVRRLQWLKFVYLGSLVHSSTQSSADISRRNAITRAAVQNLDKQIWRSRITIPTKLKLYNTCILPIFLYGSEC